MFVREARERIDRPKQDCEPRLIEVRYVGHHARTGAVIGLTPAGVKVGSCPKRFLENTRWGTGGWLELCSLLWMLHTNLADEAATSVGITETRSFAATSGM